MPKVVSISLYFTFSTIMVTPNDEDTGSVVDPSADCTGDFGD